MGVERLPAEKKADEESIEQTEWRSEIMEGDNREHDSRWWLSIPYIVVVRTGGATSPFACKVIRTSRYGEEESVLVAWLLTGCGGWIDFREAPFVSVNVAGEWGHIHV